MERTRIFVRYGRIWLLAATLLVVAAAGLSGLVYPSNYSPLIALTVVLLAVGLIVCPWRPELALCAAVFAVLLPLGLIPDSYQSLLNRSLTVIAFVAWLANAVVQRRRVLINTPAVLMMGFAAWATITLFWAEDRSAGLIIVQTYVLRLALFLVVMVNVCRSAKALNNVMNTLALGGMILAAISIWMALLGRFSSSDRLQVFGANANGLGLLGEVGLIGVLWQTVGTHRAHGLPRIVVTALYLASVIAIVGLSGSRGSAASLLLMLIILAFWRVTRPWAVFGAILLAVGAAYTLYDVTLERFISQAGDSLLGGRETLWQAAWQLIGEHPLTGVGIGNSSRAIMPYLTSFDLVAGHETVSIHNPILVIWSETGLPGVLLYLGALATALWSFVSQYLRQRKLVTQASFMPYFVIVGSVFLSYMASWFKGGGMQTDFSYFLLLALLIIPSVIELNPARQTSLVAD